MNEVLTTIFCAVWSKDAKRHALLEGHQRNLLAQTKPVEIVYVFDSGDLPPPDLRARTVTVGSQTGIYEAWNVALSLCRTPFVMNLNLDDRLAPDAVERLEREMLNFGGNLIGGDWKVCFSQEDTDAVAPVCHASEMPFLPSWPPIPNVPTRLGSGTGERGTYGPATMWRLDCHIGFPRYPYRTADNTPIKSISDSVWWNMLITRDAKKVLRYPAIIGNYYSHPSEQAEFRLENEATLISTKPISLI